MRLTKDITWVGVLDPDLRIFDVVVPTEWGTTYNSYLIKAEQACLIDNVKFEFTTEFVDKLTNEIDLTDLKYLVVNHTEPDHSGSIKALLELAPHLQVYSSRAGIQFLREQVNMDFNAVVVGHNDVLDLGDKKLRFIMAPFLHWPDTMFTYLEEDQILFTCDGFGAHYCDPEGRMLESQLDDFTEATKHYYEYTMSPFKPKILEAIDKIRDLPIRLIATGHGPILDRDPWRVVDLYQQWSSQESNDKEKYVLVGYVSAYGHTKKMAQLIAEGVEKHRGIKAILVDFANTSLAEITDNFEKVQGLIVGSPTINADAVEPVWRALSHLSGITARGKLAASFGNYGWSGEAAELIEQRLEKMRLAIVQPNLKLRFGLTEADEERCRQFGYDFGRALVKEE